MGAQEIAILALQLNPVDRFELVDQLLHSLDRPAPAINRIWLEEAERRLAACRAGKVRGVAVQGIFGSF